MSERLGKPKVSPSRPRKDVECEARAAEVEDADRTESNCRDLVHGAAACSVSMTARRAVTKEQEVNCKCAREARRQAALFRAVRSETLETAHQYELASKTDLHYDAEEPSLGSR